MLREIKSSKRLLRTLGFRIDGTVTGVKEVSTIQTVADVAGSLNDTYFIINSALNATSYYVWLNVNNAGTDPAIADKTGVEIAVATGASADTIATAIKVALDALADFVATVVTDTVTVTNASDGATTDLDDTGSTGFTLTVTTAGVTSTVSLLEGEKDAVLTEGATAGHYIITFNEAFGSNPIVSVSPLTSATICQVSSIGTTAVEVKCFLADDGTTAKDADIHVLVMGSDAHG